MKAPVLASPFKSILFCAALAAPSLAIASDVVLRKAPPLTVAQVFAYPENLARYHFGAQVKTILQNNAVAKLELSSSGGDRTTSEAALLCDDPTTGYELPAGKSGILVSLANIENIESLSLLNDGAKGGLTIALSNADVPASSPEWRNVERREMIDGPVTAKIGPGEAKYVRLTFDITAPGRIAAFGVYATPAVSDFTMPRPRKVSFQNESASFAQINYNFTDLHVRARALYASSGDLEQANKMIDDQPGSVYRFAPDDTAPTAVIDLGRERVLSRISAIYAAQPGSVDFYVLNNLPVDDSANTGTMNGSAMQIANITESTGLPGSIKLSEAAFSRLKPVGSVVGTGKGRASVDFPATTGRYVMLKWHPASVQGEGFSVAQVAAFGTSLHNRNARNAQPVQVTSENSFSDGKEIGDGKTILDNKDIPAEGPGAEAEAPAEGPPPPLPEVPPFTFIPEGVPQVPPISP